MFDKVLNTPFRSSHWRCSFYFSSFTGKHLCWSLFLIMSLSVFCKEMFWKIRREIHVSRSLCRSLSFIKKSARHRFFAVTFAKLLWKLFCRTPLVAAFDLPTHFFKCIGFPKGQWLYSLSYASPERNQIIQEKYPLFSGSIYEFIVRS